MTGTDIQQGDITQTLGDSREDDDPAIAVGGVITAPDGSQVQLSPEDAQAILDAHEQEEKDRKAMIESLVVELVSKRDACVRSRRVIERRWIDDQRQWDGESRLMNTKEFPSQTNDDNMKPPRPHLTRSRCDLWESRMIDLLAPTNDPTWELTPLTLEDLQPPQGMDVQQWQQTMQAVKEDMDQRATKMRDVIQDQLSACNATKAIRKMCVDACRMGIGLVMGPMNGTHVKRHYNLGDASMQVTIEESTVPEIREGDPWNFYPDMTPSAERAGFAFYLHSMDEIALWEFSNSPGVDKDEVLELMDEVPDYGDVETTLKERNQYSGLVESNDNRWAVWRYTGIIDRRYCEALGIESDEGPVCADIWFANRRILRSKITMLAAAKDFRIPYYVFCPFPIDDTMFGASIAYLCRDSQRICDSSLLAALHNLSVSSGPQIVIAKGLVTPADGKYSIRGPKVWFKKEEAAQLPASQIFDSNVIANNAEQLLECFSVGKQLMDEELNTTQWASPDTSEVTQTASGLAMLMNARTILQRRVCASADDDVFQPMIQRFVLWNLLYNRREDIKGDFDVRPLCQSVRLVKDIQIQQKLFVADNIAQNPMFQSAFQPYDMVADIIQSMDIHVENWLKPKQQWQQEQQAAQQQQQQDPRLALAKAQEFLTVQKANTEQARQQQIHAEALNTSSQSQVDQAGQNAQFVSPELQAKLQMHAADKQVELQNANSNLTAKQLDAQTRQMVAQMNLQAKREGIAATLHQAAQRNHHDLIKAGLHARVAVQKASTQFTPGPNPPKRPGGKFTPPKVPTFHRGRG